MKVRGISMFKWRSLRPGKRKPGETKADNKKQDSIQLWDTEFNIARNGLDRDQVVSFVTELVEKHKTAEVASSASVRSLLKKAVNDAEQLADSIKMRAETEAQSESAAIITQAQHEILEMKRKAELTALKETEYIIAAANRKAQIIEVESRQKALIFLLKAREDIEKEVMQEYKMIYSRLSASLQDLASEGQNLDVELKGKRARLLEGTQFTINEYENMLLGTADIGPAVAPDISAPAEIEMGPDMHSSKSRELAHLNEKTTVKRTEQPVEILEDSIKENIEHPVPLQEEALGEKTAMSVQPQEELVVEEMEQSILLQEEGPEEEIEQLVSIREENVVEYTEQTILLQEEPLEEETGQPVPIQEEAVTMVKEQEHTAKSLSIEDNNYLPLDQGDATLYSGEIELEIAVPVDLKMLSNLYGYLQTIRELRILHTRGSWDRGTAITVAIEKPIPLMNMIAKIADVKMKTEELEKDGSAKETQVPPLRGRRKGAKSISLVLKER